MDGLEPLPPGGLAPLFPARVQEGTRSIETVRGTLPDWLSGTTYFAGPAKFSRGGLRYGHWLDGDGLVAALRFAPGRPPWLTQRFVRSTRWREEEAAGRALYRRFGTSFPGDRLLRGTALASPVNVSVYPWAGKLLAIGEQGLPWELDPDSLATRGELTFGRLNEISPFAAHTHCDPESGELIAFGVGFSPRAPSLHLYTLAPPGELLSRYRIPLPFPASVHDFALSPSYLLFHVGPYLLDLDRLRGGGTVQDALQWEPQHGTHLLVVSRSEGRLLASIPIGTGYSLHAINAFERQDLLHVDVIEYDRPLYGEYASFPDLYTSVAAGRPVRYTLAVPGLELVARLTLPYEKAPDFPALDGPRRQSRPYDDFWCLGMSRAGQPGPKFFDELVHFDWRLSSPRIYRTAPDRYLGGEPSLTLHRDDPSRGALICQYFDPPAGESGFLVFDPFEIEAGPRATLVTSSPLPPLFHSSFAND